MISIQKAPRYLMLTYCLKQMMFLMPVLILFYQDKGVSIGDFFLIQGISWIAVFFLEIPTGYIGDVFSRKNTVLTGFVFWIFGYLCWIFGYGFCWLLLGELMFAVAISLISGTIEAYLYDLLKRTRKEHRFHQKLSKMETWANLSLMLATFTGGFMYQFLGAFFTLWVSVSCLLGAIGVCFFLPDVPEAQRKVAPQTSKWRDVLAISCQSVKHPEIKWLILYSAVYGMATLTLMWGLQSVMIATSVPVFFFSIVVGLNACMRSIWAALSAFLLEKIKLNGIIKLLIGVLFFGFLGAVVSVPFGVPLVYICLALMIMASSSAMISRVVTSILVNYRIRSDERSTVLSVKSMVSRLMAGLGMIALKPLFDTVGVSETFLIAAVLLVPIVFVSLRLVKLRLTKMPA